MTEINKEAAAKKQAIDLLWELGPSLGFNMGDLMDDFEWNCEQKKNDMIEDFYDHYNSIVNELLGE